MTNDRACCGLPPSRASLRRERIIAAARDLFATHGFHATGVAQIARVSGVGVGQIYRDFTDKEDIVAAIVQVDCAAFMAAAELRRAIEDRDAVAVIAWLRHLVEPIDDADGDRLFAEIVAEAARNDRIAAIFAATHAEATGYLQQALTMLAPGPAFADRRALLADLILTQSLGIMQHRLLMPGLGARRLADAVMFVVTREIDRMREPAVAA